MRPAPPLLAIVGPTASGKTDLALALARETNGVRQVVDRITIDPRL